MVESLKRWFYTLYKRHNIIPHEFFNVQKDTSPKAAIPLLYFTSFVGYAIAIAAFSIVFVAQNNASVTETTIETTDISDSKYTCSMASVVTKSVPTVLQTLTSTYLTASVTQYENLMNINELYGQCVSDISAINACGSGLVTELGSYSFGYDIDLLSSVYKPSDNEVIILTADNCGCAYQLQYFDLGSGIIQPSITFSSQYEYNNLISLVGYLNDVIYVSGFSQLDPANPQGQLYTNDNAGNLYLFRSAYTSTPPEYNYIMFTADGTGSVNGPSGVALNVTSGGHSISVTAWYDTATATSTVYYTNNGYVYLYTSSVPLAAISCTAFFVTYSTDGSVLYIGCEDYLTSIGIYTLSTGIFKLLPIPSPGIIAQPTLNPAYGFSTVSVEMLLLSVPLATGSLQYNLLYFNLSQNTTSQIFKGFDDSTIGWTACGAELQSTLPVNVYASNCSANALSWQLQVSYTTTDAQSAIFFTLEQANTLMSNFASTYCKGVSICDAVQNLPPYICTSKQYNTMFAVLSTALADSRALLSALFFLLGYLLPFVQSRPKKSQEATNTDDKKQQILEPTPNPQWQMICST